VHGTPCPIAEAVADEPPGGLDAVGALHAVLHHEDRTGDRKAACGVVNPGLDEAGSSNGVGHGQR